MGDVEEGVSIVTQVLISHRIFGPEARKALLGGLFVVVCGLILGFSTNKSGDLNGGYARLSNVIGWIYFMGWSISFYPQLYLNWCRKSVVGLSFDFVLLNFIGFLYYSIFNGCFYWNDSIQDEYEAKHDGNPNLVKVNDVFFALHAVLAVALLFPQMVLYERGDQQFSTWALVCAGVFVGSAVLYMFIVLIVGHGVFSWLNWVYFLSYVKLVISFIKYLPQVYLNWSRKSTSGWTIWNVLLDFMGGSLSVMQLLLDANNENDWSGVTGDPVKFGLGFVSIFFDLVFMWQHYVLYGDAELGTGAAVGRSRSASTSNVYYSLHGGSEEEATPLTAGARAN